MANSVEQEVDLARRGQLPSLICRMKSGWAVLAGMQYLRGYCLLLADPIAGSLNELDARRRSDFLLDMCTIGDAIKKVTGAYRVNYGIMGNTDPFLHAHITPRFLDEPEAMLHNHPWAYPDEIVSSRPFDPARDADLIRRLRLEIPNTCP